MGWRSWEKLGRSGGELDGTEQQAHEVQPYFVDRPALAGLGAAPISRPEGAGPYLFQTLLDQLLLKCRTSQVTPLSWHRSVSFDADRTMEN
eukprot:3686317-Pyramimonas_sp.AAC.1